MVNIPSRYYKSNKQFNFHLYKKENADIVNHAEIEFPGAKHKETMILYFLNENDAPGCETCNKPLRIQHPNRQSRFCDAKCAANSPTTKSTRKTTVLDRYGVDNISQNQQSREAVSKKISEYRKRVPVQPAIQEMRDNGTYGEYIDNMVENSRNTREEKYGGWMDGLKTNISLDEFRNLSEKYNQRELANIIGCSHSRVGQILRELRLPIVNHHHNTSLEEQSLFAWLQKTYPEGEWESRNRTVIAPKELDIYSPVYKIAIEYNGLYWHSSGSKDNDKKMSVYHLVKTRECNKIGVQLFHIFEGDDMALWKSMLKSAMGKTRRIYARNTRSVIVKHSEIKDFLNENHMQGSSSCKTAIALFHELELVAVMTFSKARYSDADYEILRFCNKAGVTVVGGASKLLRKFIRITGACKIVSYANLRWSNGGLYESTGFDYMHDSQPCYWYFKHNKKLHHRSTFMKHKLKDKLDTFEPSLSEVENMYNNGYRRIWDCGNKVYIKTFE